MTARPVSQFLARFGPQDPPEAAAVHEELICSSLSVEARVQDPSALIQAARDEGKAEGLAESHAAHVAAIEQERLLFEARLSTDRANWTKQEAELLAAKFVTALSDIEENIAGSVARVLRGLLIDSVRREAVMQLADDVRTLLAGKERALVEISGAADLLAALRENLSSFGKAIEYAPNQAPDVKVVADQAIIETHIEAWIERVNALSE